MTPEIVAEIRGLLKMRANAGETEMMIAFEESAKRKLWNHAEALLAAADDNAALREAVRVLAKEVHEWRTWSDEECRGGANSRHDTNLNPLASAAITAAKEHR